MGGLFDTMAVSKSGMFTSRAQMAVTGNNIAHASDPNYTLQRADISSLGSLATGNLILGEGVKIDDIIRVRDTLLDVQLRNSTSTQASYAGQSSWLSQIQSIYNEPSANGISSALTNLWQSWSQLATNPENTAARAAVLSRTSNLATLIQGAHSKLSVLQTNVNQAIGQQVGDINGITTQIANLNKQILTIEAGQPQKANDLRDNRDAALDSLSKKVDITYQEGSNGMVTVYIGDHPVVNLDKSENIVLGKDPLDNSKLKLSWALGENHVDVSGGEMASLLNIRDRVIPKNQADLDSFASTLITQINNIYSKGVGSQPSTLIQSRLGYQSLGVPNAQTALNLAPTGQQRTIHVSFYDSTNAITRAAGIVIDSTDTLDAVQIKLNGIPGITATLIVDPANPSADNRLSLKMNPWTADTGEVAFAISDNTGSFDTSSFLGLVGFNQTAKTQNNATTTQPTLTGVDLNTLKAQLGVTSVANVMSKQLNLSGTFTINGFETQTESGVSPSVISDGHNIQQLSINVTSTDSINSIMAKVNALTVKYGVSMGLNGSNQLKLTSTAKTDAAGNFTSASGATGNNFLRLSFANTYQFPSIANDTPPADYNGLGDNSNLFSKMQLNTLLQGSDASTIEIDSRITSPSQMNAGYKLLSGDNSMALDMTNLQSQLVAGGGQYTISGNYQNIISGVGTSVQQNKTLTDNETAVLKNFVSEKNSISGVNLDEELANMIQYQRTFQANGKMFSTVDQMIQELLGLSR